METQNMLRSARMKEKQIFWRQKHNRFATALTLIKYLKTDLITEIAPYVCAPVSELPSNMSTMGGDLYHIH